MASDPAFQSINDLERALLRAKGGVAPLAEFVGEMMRSQVVLLIDKEVRPGEGWDNSAHPLILQTDEGVPGICIFTSLDRPGVWLDRFPEFRWCLPTPFIWFIKGVQPGTALLVNPGWDEGLIIRSEMVQELRRIAETA
jgi:hypothetical protein